MPVVTVPAIKPRPYQLPALRYWLDRDPADGPGRAVEVWARRCGKDITYASIALALSFERRGLYLHFLPEFERSRRTLWNGFDNEGNRFIDRVFPPPVRKSVHEHDMRIELINGSTWRLGGSDRYDTWVGGNPIWCCFSEYSQANPAAWQYMRPILRDNGGHAAFVSTPRGYNALHDVLQIAKAEPTWRWSVVTAIDAGTLTQADIDAEVRQGMDESLARQEFLCDFSVADAGSILGRYLEEAEQNGRLSRDPIYDPSGGDIILSSDIGYHDTAVFWFWQRALGGFRLVDYIDGCGMDAEEWIDALKQKPWPIETVYLPHDARAKTFATRHSVVERFALAYGSNRVRIAPAMKAQDKVNAARHMVRKCQFDAVACAQGLVALRAWGFEYDEDTKRLSKTPRHDWASHAGDAFAYGSAMLSDQVMQPAEVKRPATGADKTWSLDQLYADRGGASGRLA